MLLLGFIERHKLKSGTYCDHIQTRPVAAVLLHQRALLTSVIPTCTARQVSLWWAMSVVSGTFRGGPAHAYIHIHDDGCGLMAEAREGTGWH
jgi:hypothetical protein